VVGQIALLPRTGRDRGKALVYANKRTAFESITGLVSEQL